MHPQSTQVPPRPSRSTTAVERPSWPHRMAPTYPAGPPPRKITSKEAMDIGVESDQVSDGEYLSSQESYRLRTQRAARPLIAGHAAALAVVDSDLPARATNAVRENDLQ